MRNEQDEPLEPEIIPPDTGLVRSQASTVEELSQTDDGIVIVERGIQIMKTLRAASIAVTFPHDWVLFKADDRITGYCQDAGCQRFSDFWGIDIINIRDWERVEDAETEGKPFSWSVTADGVSKRTGQIVTGITGVRYSYEEFIVRRKLNRLQIEAEVKKAARANLHGSIVRELAGMKQVPVEELDLVWGQAQMTGKTSAKCPRGRGFGTGDQRVGGATEGKDGGISPVDVPVCDYCRPTVKLVYRPNGNPPFWGCPNYTKHPDKKMIVSHADLLKRLDERKAAAAATETRQPGEEG